MSGVINDPRRFFGADPLYIGKLKKKQKKNKKTWVVRGQVGWQIHERKDF